MLLGGSAGLESLECRGASCSALRAGNGRRSFGWPWPTAALRLTPRWLHRERFSGFPDVRAEPYGDSRDKQRTAIDRLRSGDAALLSRPGDDHTDGHGRAVRRPGLLAVDARRWAAVSASCLLAATVGSLPSASHAATALSPALFEEVSTGVALIRTYGCGGRAVGQGTGFLVGDSVVMTARHVLQGACRVRVRVNGETFTGKKWVYWSGGRASEEAADLGTVKLDRAAVGGHLFRVRSSGPPAGANLAMVGYPLGNRLSLNQGKIIERGRVDGALCWRSGCWVPRARAARLSSTMRAGLWASCRSVWARKTSSASERRGCSSASISRAGGGHGRGWTCVARTRRAESPAASPPPRLVLPAAAPRRKGPRSRRVQSVR